MTDEQAIIAALEEAEKQARHADMRAQSRELLNDPDDLAESQAIQDDMRSLRTWDDPAFEPTDLYEEDDVSDDDTDRWGQSDD